MMTASDARGVKPQPIRVCSATCDQETAGEGAGCTGSIMTPPQGTALQPSPAALRVLHKLRRQAVVRVHASRNSVYIGI